MVTNANPRTRTDYTALAVAAAPKRAAELTRLLAQNGLSVGGETDLDVALLQEPALLVVDPEGWESSCRVALEAFPRRSMPPPAVLFASLSPLVAFTAGPAFDVLRPDDGPGALIDAVERALLARERFCSYWPTILSPLPKRDLHRIAAILERMAGLEIRADRSAAFVEAVRQRLVARLIPNVREYASLLEGATGTEAEVEILCVLLSVGETHFWRYSGQFRALQSLLIPEITTREKYPRRLRLWSAGCASGEEVYSLAIACQEVLPSEWDWEVVGTDIHRPALAAAARGLYGARALRNLPEELRARYFVVDTGGARVREDLRRSVRFEALNLGGFGLRAWIRQHGPFDAIFCRNTLIYFSRPAVERVLSAFENGLLPGGGLFLGASETLGHERRSFRTVRGPGCFFSRKEVSGAVVEGADRVVACSPPARDDPEIPTLYRRGLECADREDFSGAGEAFQSILDLDPKDGRGHTGLGLLLANEGRETEALTHLEMAGAHGPDGAETHYLLGLVKERLGREQEALTHYGRALGRDPSFFMAHFNRAWIMKRAGRKDAFLVELRHVRRLLESRPVAAPWLTGGVSVDALLGLVDQTLCADGAAT